MLSVNQSASASDLFPNHWSRISDCVLETQFPIWPCVFPPSGHISWMWLPQWLAPGRAMVKLVYYLNAWNHKSLYHLNEMTILNTNLIHLYSRNNAISMNQTKNKLWNDLYQSRINKTKHWLQSHHSPASPASSFLHLFGFFASSDCVATIYGCKYRWQKAWRV